MEILYLVALIYLVIGATIARFIIGDDKRLPPITREVTLVIVGAVLPVIIVSLLLDGLFSVFRKKE